MNMCTSEAATTACALHRAECLLFPFRRLAVYQNTAAHKGYKGCYCYCYCYYYSYYYYYDDDDYSYSYYSCYSCYCYYYYYS